MDISQRGKTTPDSTPGSFAAVPAVRSRVEMDHSGLRDALTAATLSSDSRLGAESRIDAVLAVYDMTCDECGAEMWVDEEGDPHHKDDDSADDDHTALCGDAADFDPDDPMQAALLTAVSDQIDSGAMTVAEVEHWCYAEIRARFEAGS